MADSQSPRTSARQRHFVVAIAGIIVVAAISSADEVVPASGGRRSGPATRPSLHVVVAADPPLAGATEPRADAEDAEDAEGAEDAEIMAQEAEEDDEADEANEASDSDPDDPSVVFLPDPSPSEQPGGGLLSSPWDGPPGQGGFGLGAGDEQTPPNEALVKLSGRLARLRESRDEITRQIATAEGERSAIVDPKLRVEDWARVIRQRVASLEDDDVRQAGRAMVRLLMRRIGGTGSVVIEEGVARGVDDETLLAMAGRKEVRRTGGFWYHAEPLRCSPASAARLTALVIDPANLAGPGGGKFCGGFHPDLRLDYRNAGVTVLVCFGCRDIRYESIDTTVTFDLTEASLGQFQAIARDIFQHREFDCEVDADFRAR